MGSPRIPDPRPPPRNAASSCKRCPAKAGKALLVAAHGNKVRDSDLAVCDRCQLENDSLHDITNGDHVASVGRQRTRSNIATKPRPEHSICCSIDAQAGPSKLPAPAPRACQSCPQSQQLLSRTFLRSSIHVSNSAACRRLLADLAQGKPANYTGVSKEDIKHLRRVLDYFQAQEDASVDSCGAASMQSMFGRGKDVAEVPFEDGRA